MSALSHEHLGRSSDRGIGKMEPPGHANTALQVTQTLALKGGVLSLSLGGIASSIIFILVLDKNSSHDRCLGTTHAQ